MLLAKKRPVTDSTEGCRMIKTPFRKPATPPLQHEPERVQGIVQEYTDALQKLCATCAQGPGDQDALEQQILEARAVLVLARAALLRERVEHKRVHQLAMHDRVTALPNRKYLLERLELALADPRPPRQALAVLQISLDSGGHDCNETLLKIVAARLNRSVRAEDMVCRIGGDEFACLLPGLPSRERLGQAAAMLSDAVPAHVKIGGVEIHPHPNVGIAMFPGDGASAEILLKSADAAMWFARRRRTPFAFFGDGAAAPRTDRAELIL
jgi:diguanylate cyclase (GGDEF)-like protein